uniref:AI-2E family transporter n=1 Tax=Solibacter usitatus (strain Ellin6076) TaxID=234267 RepID=Q022Z7_SOLUE
MIKPQRLAVSSSIRTAGILIGVIFVLYAAREIFVPLAFAITLALILSPAVAWLQTMRVARTLAVALVMMITIALACGTAWVIFNQLVDVANDLPRYQQNIDSKLKAIRAPGKGALGRATASVKELGKELSAVPATPAPIPGARIGRRPENQPGRPVAVQVVDEPATELEYVRDVVRPFLGPFGVAGMVLIFSVFLLTKQNDLRNRLFRLVGLDQLNMMTQALDDATSRVSRYLLMQFLVNVGFGTLCGAGLYLIGIPYAVLWGCVAAILRLVPYAGAIVAASLPFMLSLAVFDNWTPPLLVFLLFATLEVGTGNFIEPMLYGAHTGISALALLLTTVFWTALWGPPGLILSTPLTVCVVVLGRYVPQFSFLHIILGDETVLAPEAHVYQRLLAMDDREARAVADLYLEGHTLSELYDFVIIPALSMAEQDRHKGALEPVRRDFLFLSIKEMVVEFSEKTGADEAGLPGHQVAQPASARIFVVPASDEADEIAAAMLAQLLSASGHAAIPFPVDFARDEKLAIVVPRENDLFCISALPPFAFAGAITLVRQLKLRFPRTRIIAGVWGFSGNTERALQRFQQSQPDYLVTSLATALSYVAEIQADVTALATQQD